jgi:hypothetical protein
MEKINDDFKNIGVESTGFCLLNEGLIILLKNKSDLEKVLSSDINCKRFVYADV